MIYPFVWAITASFKTSAQIYSGNPLDLVPKPFTLENYRNAWGLLPFHRFLLNSLIVSIVVSVVSIVISSMAAYSFARLRFKGRDILFLVLLGVMMLPGHITLIPCYALMRMLGWINTYFALIIPPIFNASLVFNIFFMRQYFLGIPKELEEAALLDGCSRFRVWWKIIIPNSKPAIATIAIISFKQAWNSFLWPNVVINDYMKMPIQVGLTYIQSSNEPRWAIAMAGTTTAIIPMILIFIFFQRYFISGVLTSGLGGR
ncbi:carbohydrate ABC transporter permease [Candidatus Atribacteria bacterium HGW-Atribacteria-1]|nr:MAG: carbohydrate ABC transporter permease [Candidatus Atribacteria bacterium HGW-Atribacteria-1]